jgi:molecular chaperone GrpE
MSTSGGKKGHDRQRRVPDEPEKPAPDAGEDDDSIEILEVVGVDESTGSERSRRPPASPAPETDADRAAPAPSSQARQLQEAIQAKDKYYDLLLRKQAEFENYRKRSEKEHAELRAGAAADLVMRILPVLDNLERALRTREGTDGPLRQGVVLIHQQILDLLKKSGLREMETLGTHFDPQIHEAVQVLDVEGFEQGMILEETRKGYTFHDRLLRPAMVKVASGNKPKAAGPGSKTGA